MNYRNLDDELILSEIIKINPNGLNKLYIFDARSYLSAQANRLNRGGFENTKDFYTNSEIVFCDIDNIHAVRDSITKIYEIGNTFHTSSNMQQKWFTLLDNSNWL